MNFLNDSLKTLKNVLQEGLDTKVDFDGTSSDVGDAETKPAGSQQHENLRKLCEHQSEEVNSRCFRYCAVSLAVVYCT